MRIAARPRPMSGHVCAIDPAGAWSRCMPPPAASRAERRRGSIAPSSGWRLERVRSAAPSTRADGRSTAATPIIGRRVPVAAALPSPPDRAARASGVCDRSTGDRRIVDHRPRGARRDFRRARRGQKHVTGIGRRRLPRGRGGHRTDRRAGTRSAALDRCAWTVRDRGMCDERSARSGTGAGGRRRHRASLRPYANAVCTCCSSSTVWPA